MLCCAAAPAAAARVPSTVSTAVGVQSTRMHEPSTLVQLASREWVVPRLSPPTLLQAAQLRLLLASLLHARLGARAAVVVKDVDVVESIARFIRGCRPLAWTLARDTLAIDVETSSVVMAQGGDYGTALCHGSPMRDGLHYAEFELLSSHLVTLGVADMRFDPTGEERMATATEHGWGYRAWDGKHSHASTWSAWEGMQPATCGDKVGLLMDCDSGQLSVFKNGEWLGLLKQGLGGPRPPGQQQRQELCWMAQLWVDGAAVRVRREERPPQRSREREALRLMSDSAQVPPQPPRPALVGLAEQVPPWPGGWALTSSDDAQREASGGDLATPLHPLPAPGQQQQQQQQLSAAAMAELAQLAAAAPALPPPLPAGWVVVTSRADGAPYFHNPHTGETCWHIPPPDWPPPRPPGAGPAAAPLGGGGGGGGGGAGGGGALPQGTLRRELLARQRSRTV
jgi:hypothetical protein